MLLGSWHPRAEARNAHVCVVERDAIGKATSWAAAGILPPANFRTAMDPIDQLRGLSHDLFPAWSKRLCDQTDIDIGLRRCGAFYLAQSVGERASMVGMTNYWHQLQIQCEPVQLSELVQREPAMRELVGRNNDLSAWWVPDERQVRSPDYLLALTEGCRATGVMLMPHCAVREIEPFGDSYRIMLDSNSGSVSTKASSIDADMVVVCAGAWTGKLATWLRLENSLIPVRGQIVQLKTNKPILKSIVNVGHRYLVCRDDGHVLVGSCEEEVGFQLGTTSTQLDALRRFARETCPVLAQANEVASWSGLRPMTFDGFPMIGRVPDTDNVFVAAGHFRSGLHLSPATAVCVADMVTGKQPPIDLRAFQVAKQQSAGIENQSIEF